MEPKGTPLNFVSNALSLEFLLGKCYYKPRSNHPGDVVNDFAGIRLVSCPDEPIVSKTRKAVATYATTTGITSNPSEKEMSRLLVTLVALIGMPETRAIETTIQTNVMPFPPHPEGCSPTTSSVIPAIVAYAKNVTAITSEEVP